jgi:hypothetical protein
MKLTSGPSSSIKFCKEIPKGFPLHVPTTPQVLVVEKAVPHWGVLKSIELGVYRDGTIANNIATRNIGIQEKDGELILTFQLLDETTDSVQLHAYNFEATLNFFSYV